MLSPVNLPVKFVELLLSWLQEELPQGVLQGLLVTKGFPEIQYSI